MSVLLALLAMQPAVLAVDPAPASQATEEAIVVIGQRLKTWRGKVRTKKGQLVCKTTKSTGDKAIDAIGCDAMIACFGPLQPDLQAIADSDLPKEEKNRRISELSSSLTPCMADKHDKGIMRLAEARAEGEA